MSAEFSFDTLPDGWRPDTLGGLFDVQQGKALSPEARGGVSRRPFLRTRNVLWGRLDLANVDTMGFDESEASRLTLQDRDLLVCEGGEIGRTAIWRGELPSCLYQNHIHRLRRKKTDEIDPLFVMYWLQAAFLHLGLYEGIGNRTTIPNLSGARLKDLPVPVPDTREQGAVAVILSKLQAAVALEGARVRELKSLKATTLAKLFREGLNGTAARGVGIEDAPAGWHSVLFGEFATLHRGYDLPLQDRHSGTVAVIGSSGTVGFHNEARVPGPGVIVGRSGSVGSVFFSDKDFWPLNTALFVEDFHGNSPLFAYYFMQQFDFSAFGAGVSVPTLNRNVVHGQLIAIPSPKEQEGIVVVLRGIDASIAHAEERLSVKRQLFGALLTLLMSGELRTTHPLSPGAMNHG